MMKRALGTIGLMTLFSAGVLLAQGQRPASPAGTASVQIGGSVTMQGGEYSGYPGGKWIDVTYGRPLLRQRADIFGSGADYGKFVNGGAPVWRVGANQTTRFKSEADLLFGAQKLPAGEYSMFIDLKPNAWTLIFSTWPAQQRYDPNNKEALWGSFNYTPDKDVLRAPMTVTTLPYVVDQLTILFVDATKTGAKLAVMWDKTMATSAFTLAAK
jgi:hypothetical protein